MAVNNKPVVPGIPANGWDVLSSANTAKDGTGTVATVFTAHAAYGSRVDFLKVRAKGTNVATVLRVWLNNGSTNATAGNNSLFVERTLPATTLSETSELQDVVIPMDVSLPPGYKVNVTIGTAISAGIHISAHGGHYVENP